MKFKHWIIIIVILLILGVLGLMSSTSQNINDKARELELKNQQLKKSQ